MSNACQILHDKFAALPRFSANYQAEQIPSNGIYIVFEKDETAHNTDRIVRIGTHTGDGNLAKRIGEHLYTPKKDRSIFRKHIGRCILNKRGDAFLQQWEIDLTTRASKDKHAGQIDLAMQDRVEQEVSAYIASNLEFAVISVSGKEERLCLESGLLSTIAACTDCSPSQHWLGCHHPKSKIPNAGLWNVLGMNKRIMSQEEAQDLVSLI